MGKAIVLGGYGLIGAACVRALHAEGFDVAGIGRSAAAARASNLPIDWLIRDIPAIDPEGWREMLRNVDVVVNAAGALQDGGRDDLEAIHAGAMARLVEGTKELPLRIVQISAAGVAPDASTEFFRSKARGDAIVATAPDWVILKPTLVLAPGAYGGTALLRAVSALPLVLPRALPTARIQSVDVADVASAVVAAAKGRVPSQTIADLTGPGEFSLDELTVAIRAWQGFPPARWRPRVPDKLVNAVGAMADVLGRLGWRSPFRTTALRALKDGVGGDAAAWYRAGGNPCRSLEETLARMPATRQERVFARVYLALPLAIAVLSLFWVVSGLVALADVPAARAVLTGSAAASFSGPIVIGGALGDLTLGLAILWRPAARLAALGMVALSAIYLLASLFTAPALWLDPLGPMVKVLPGMALAGIVWLLLEER